MVQPTLSQGGAPIPVSDLRTEKGKSPLHGASWPRTNRAGMAGYNVSRGTRRRTKYSGRTAPLPALFPRRWQQYELEGEGRPGDGRWPARRKIPIQPRAEFNICHHRNRHGTATSDEVGYRDEFRRGVWAGPQDLNRLISLVMRRGIIDPAAPRLKKVGPDHRSSSGERRWKADPADGENGIVAYFLPGERKVGEVNTIYSVPCVE